MLQKAPFSGLAEAALISPALRTPPVKPKARFSNGHQSKGSSGRGSAECWEMRLSVRTGRPSILLRPPYQNLTARENVERKGLMGRVVIGLGYQRADEAFKAPTCPFSEHEGREMTGFTVAFLFFYFLSTRGSVSFRPQSTTKQHTFATHILIHNSFWLRESYKTGRAYRKCQQRVCNFTLRISFSLVVKIFRRLSVGCYFKEVSLRLLSDLAFLLGDMGG